MAAVSRGAYLARSCLKFGGRNSSLIKGIKPSELLQGKCLRNRACSLSSQNKIFHLDNLFIVIKNFFKESKTTLLKIFKLASASGFVLQRQFSLATYQTNLIDQLTISKPSALTLAINEAEVTSIDESDEDDEATLYILSEMFQTLSISSDGG